jgi:hypothetical protein
MIAKRKMNFPKNTRNTALEDTRYKLSIDNFQTKHETALISNFILFSFYGLNEPANKKKSIIKMISTTENSPLLDLSIADYNKHHRILVKYKLQTLEDIKRFRHNQTLDYNTFCSADRSRYKIALEVVVPEFFVAFVRAVTKTFFFEVTESPKFIKLQTSETN